MKQKKDLKNDLAEEMLCQPYFVILQASLYINVQTYESLEFKNNSGCDKILIWKFNFNCLILIV